MGRASFAEPAGWGWGLQPLREVTLIVVEGDGQGVKGAGRARGALQGPLALKTKIKTKSCTILLTNNGQFETLKWFRN